MISDLYIRRVCTCDLVSEVLNLRDVQTGYLPGVARLYPWLQIPVGEKP